MNESRGRRSYMTRRYDHDQFLRSIGGIPIQEAAEPLEHMTEFYTPEHEDGEDGPTDEHPK
jgi:hypothetical protein